MNKSKQSNLNTFLNVDYKEDNSIWLTNSLTLRKIIGVLGMAMPLLLYAFLYFDNGMQHPLESISHYYYTRVSGIFLIILSLLAFFLIVYKGKEPVDFYISLFAGFFALLVKGFCAEQRGAGNIRGKWGLAGKFPAQRPGASCRSITQRSAAGMPAARRGTRPKRSSVFNALSANRKSPGVATPGLWC